MHTPSNTMARRCRRTASCSDPPEIGRHNDEMLAVIGYDQAGIAGLKSAGMPGPANN